jgi:hypothetical protein
MKIKFKLWWTTHPPINKTKNPKIYQSTNPLITKYSNQQIHQSTNTVINKSTNQQIHQSTNRLINKTNNHISLQLIEHNTKVHDIWRSISRFWYWIGTHNVERLNPLFLLLSFPLYCTRNIYLFSIVVRRTQNILQVKRNIGMKDFTGTMQP